MTTLPEIIESANRLDVAALLRLANEARVGKTVDWDMRGTPITDCNALLWSAYGPAARRVIVVAVERFGAKDGTREVRKLSREKLLALAPEAIGEGVDRDFAGNVILSYSLLLKEYAGYGRALLDLTNLAIKHKPILFLR